MADIAAVLKQLQEERSRMDQAIAALAQLNGDLGSGARGSRGRRPLSAAARQRIAAAQRARWAKLKAGKSAGAKSSLKSKMRRVMSAAARRKIAAAQKARWAKLKK